MRDLASRSSLPPSAPAELWARLQTRALECESGGAQSHSSSQACETASAEDATVGRLRESIVELFNAITYIVNDETEVALNCLQRVAESLHVDANRRESRSNVQKISRPIPRGGLAPWQARLVKTHIETHLDRSIRTTELAKVADLSSFHFCRVFRVSFGKSPHQYITRRRVERAQGLMLATDLPLGQIAIDCGFADQAHFTKLFRRFEGQSPGEWRRTRAEAPEKRVNGRLEAHRGA